MTAKASKAGAGSFFLVRFSTGKSTAENENMGADIPEKCESGKPKRMREPALSVGNEAPRIFITPV
jgi:hypothetical protein